MAREKMSDIINDLEEKNLLQRTTLHTQNKLIIKKDVKIKQLVRWVDSLIAIAERH